MTLLMADMDRYPSVFTHNPAAEKLSAAYYIASLLLPTEENIHCIYCFESAALERIQNLITRANGKPFGNSEQMTISCCCEYCGYRICNTSVAYRCANGHGLCVTCGHYVQVWQNSMIETVVENSILNKDIVRTIADYAIAFGHSDNDWD